MNIVNVTCVPVNVKTKNKVGIDIYLLKGGRLIKVCNFLFDKNDERKRFEKIVNNECNKNDKIIVKLKLHSKIPFLTRKSEVLIYSVKDFIIREDEIKEDKYPSNVKIIVHDCYVFPLNKIMKSNCKILLQIFVTEVM